MGIISIFTQPDEAGTITTSIVHVRTLKLRGDITWPGSNSWPVATLVFEPGQSGTNPKHLRTSGPHPSGLGAELGHSQGTALLDEYPGYQWEE